MPIGYFPIVGMTGAEKANLVNIALEKLVGIGVSVVSLICDGPPSHFAMLSELGTSLDAQNMQTFFLNPHDSNQKIFAFLDVCHMLKLVRNNFKKVSVMYDGNGQRISWEYISNLAEMQEEEGLKMANKLTLGHVNFEQQKMKVKLAAQALSGSVATAIQYCDKVLKLPQFKGSEGTVKFIQMIDTLFDVLNSRNPCAKGTKSALRLDNRETWEPFLEEAYEYIKNLKDPAGIYMHTTQRKTGFIGFMAAISSAKGLFYDLVFDKGVLRYLLMYKFSQDHLELFFGAVRAAGGCSNNPTVRRFVAIYKRLLLRSSIGGGRGNCEAMDETNLLHIMDDVCRVNGSVITLSEISLIRKYDLGDRQPMSSDHDYSDAPNMSKLSLSEFKKPIIAYISGFAAKTTAKHLMCKECCDALGSQQHISQSRFISAKDKGGLFKPSVSVIKICEEAEIKFQRMINRAGGQLPRDKGRLFCCV